MDHHPKSQADGRRGDDRYASMTSGPLDIGEYLVSARSFSEYRAMFALTDDDLTGRVLDCPGGAASFTAAAAGLGCDAVAVDPVYAATHDALATRLAVELERGRVWAAATADRYGWDFYGSPEGHARLRADSAQTFLRDRASRPDRYVTGALPSLPFPDSSFDLVLSSHLLFTYADRLDLDFHRTALREMARVSRGQVRVFPLVDQAGHDRPELLAALLADDELRATVRTVDFEFQHGARSMLQLDARRSAP